MAWTTPKTYTSAVLTSAEKNTYERDNMNFLKVNIALGAASELTIADGVVTKTQAHHHIDTASDGATDDLDTISGGAEGDVIIIRAEHTDRSIVVKDGTGNIDCDADITLDTTEKFVVLIYDGTNWQLLVKRAT